MGHNSFKSGRFCELLELILSNLKGKSPVQKFQKTTVYVLFMASGVSLFQLFGVLMENAMHSEL